MDLGPRFFADARDVHLEPAQIVRRSACTWGRVPRRCRTSDPRFRVRVDLFPGEDVVHGLLSTSSSAAPAHASDRAGKTAAASPRQPIVRPFRCGKHWGPPSPSVPGNRPVHLRIGLWFWPLGRSAALHLSVFVAFSDGKPVPIFPENALACATMLDNTKQKRPLLILLSAWQPCRSRTAAAAADPAGSELSPFADRHTPARRAELLELHLESSLHPDRRGGAVAIPP